jgi:hypothetical protein
MRAATKVAAARNSESSNQMEVGGPGEDSLESHRLECIKKLKIIPP